MREVLKLKYWPHFSGEGEYDHIELIRCIYMRKKYFELPESLVTARFESWTWGKIQIINKWVNDSWRVKVKKAFESSKFNSDKDKYLPWFCKKKDILIELYPDMSVFIIHRKILRQCGGDLDQAFKSRTTEQCSAEDIMNILEEVITRNRIGSNMVNLKTRSNTPWKDSVDKNPIDNSNNMKYKSADLIKKFDIFQINIHLANKCPKGGKVNEIYIEKEPDVGK
ncbi:hypothetical protein O181_061975 [Austropuccinia psidii MF-1]|uniref:Uncharacterized protein n=1 Tax=Austropuccinia psidii MF-1 TaxID=1389203 RepID=A0A9Q3ENG2_9BASI|nr:hypothetical protein [Austropuccinia psidii MF-1]